MFVSYKKSVMRNQMSSVYGQFKFSFQRILSSTNRLERQ